MVLSETWFMEGYVDFELQKYRLLAYLQEVNKYFNESKLYPQLADVIFHHNNLLAFRENKKLLQGQFPKRIDQVDIRNLEVVYEEMLADDEVMKELETITQFAAERMRSTIENGAEIYEFVEKQTRLEPVGIVPLYKNEGYLLIKYGTHPAIKAYGYSLTLFEHKDARYKGIKMQYVDSWQKSITNTYENIKREIIRSIPVLPNPAVYCIESELAIPFEETLLPIAKRMLVKELSTHAA